MKYMLGLKIHSTGTKHHSMYSKLYHHCTVANLQGIESSTATLIVEGNSTEHIAGHSSAKQIQVAQVCPCHSHLPGSCVLCYNKPMPWDGLKKVVKTRYTLANANQEGRLTGYLTKMIALLAVPPLYLAG